MEHAQRTLHGTGGPLADQRAGTNLDGNLGQQLDTQLRTSGAHQRRSQLCGQRGRDTHTTEHRRTEVGETVDDQPRPALRVLEPAGRRLGVLQQEDRRHADGSTPVVLGQRIRIPLGQRRRHGEPRCGTFAVGNGRGGRRLRVDAQRVVLLHEEQDHGTLQRRTGI